VTRYEYAKEDHRSVMCENQWTLRKEVQYDKNCMSQRKGYGWVIILKGGRTSCVDGAWSGWSATVRTMRLRSIPNSSAGALEVSTSHRKKPQNDIKVNRKHFILMESRSPWTNFIQNQMDYAGK